MLRRTSTVMHITAKWCMPRWYNCYHGNRTWLNPNNTTEKSVSGLKNLKSSFTVINIRRTSQQPSCFGREWTIHHLLLMFFLCWLAHLMCLVVWRIFALGSFWVTCELNLFLQELPPAFYQNVFPNWIKETNILSLKPWTHFQGCLPLSHLFVPHSWGSWLMFIHTVGRSHCIPLFHPISFSFPKEEDFDVLQISLPLRLRNGSLISPGFAVAGRTKEAKSPLSKIQMEMASQVVKRMKQSASFHSWFNCN